MPRVETKTKNTGGKHVYNCVGPCELASRRDGDRSVRAGDRYYTWKGRRSGRQFKHVECGYPRPSQVSGRKTAVVDDAVLDADSDLAGWAPDLPYEVVHAGQGLELADVSDLEAMLQAVAEEARNVAQEYEGSADNMPESLQQGAQAEAMRDVAQRLEEWADNLDNWSASCDTEIEVPADYTGSDADKAKLQEAWDAAVEDLRTEAQDHLNSDGVPEYEG